MAVPSRSCLSFMRTAVRAMPQTQSEVVSSLSRVHPALRPPVDRSMRDLDRGFFQKTVSLAAAAPIDGKHINVVRGRLASSRDLFNFGRIKPIRESSTSPSGKCILLKPSISISDSSTWSPALRQVIEQEQSALLEPFTLQMTYEDWSPHDILESILPEDHLEEIPTGFAQVGHIAHVNIREQYLPYRHLIAQVLLDKNPKVTTVINKIEDVGSDNIFRTFPYEVLAGPDEMDVSVSHNGCDFNFNFAKVYWNTRLNTEHTRIIDKLKEGEALCDVMAGVGPFAVPAGKQKRVFVRANDLNPDGCEAMRRAIVTNKVGQFVQADCMDGRQFIKQSAQELMTSPRTATVVEKFAVPKGVKVQKMARQQSHTREIKEPRTFGHYVMNLPATAVEFLDAFRGVYKGHEDLFEPTTDRKLPMIHVYLFCTQSEAMAGEVEAEGDDEWGKADQACCAKVSKYLGHTITYETPDVEVFDVRLVSPKKKMYCVSFRLPREVAFAG